MNVHSHLVTSVSGIGTTPEPSVNLVLGFGEKALLENGDVYPALRARYPEAIIALSSSAGEIHGAEVYDNSLSLVALSFERTRLRKQGVSIGDYENSFTAGKAVADGLYAEDLRHVLIMSDGALVNGSELVKGIQSVIPKGVSITGGLAGDGAEFNYTVVGINEAPRQGRIAAIGLYGSHLRVAHGSFGGWQPFGMEKVVTRSNANELFEINGKSALGIYKEYLGRYASELPGSALLFPLAIQLAGRGESLVRTILSIDEERSSMTFAGDIPEGSKVRFMKANIDKLVDAASTAASTALEAFEGTPPEVALLTSCVGRKLVLGKRVDEEVEAVADLFGSKTVLTGYYSYGEISPVRAGGGCQLHNQTMTITCMSELE